MRECTSELHDGRQLAIICGPAPPFLPDPAQGGAGYALALWRMGYISAKEFLNVSRNCTGAAATIPPPPGTTLLAEAPRERAPGSVARDHSPVASSRRDRTSGAGPSHRGPTWNRTSRSRSRSPGRSRDRARREAAHSPSNKRRRSRSSSRSRKRSRSRDRSSERGLSPRTKRRAGARSPPRRQLPPPPPPPIQTYGGIPAMFVCMMGTPGSKQRDSIPESERLTLEGIVHLLEVGALGSLAA